MTEQLKPCPFCGKQADLIESEPSKARFNQGCVHFAVSCSDFNCEVMPKGNLWHITPQDAVKAWNTRADGWISFGEHPMCSGRYMVDSSYGVRDAFFSEGFIVGDFRWQDCETGNDEGVENYDGIEFEVYNWMPLPKPPKVTK